MADNKIDIRDDEFRVIGSSAKFKPSSPAQDNRRRNIGVAILSATLVFAIGVMAIVFWPKEVPENPNDGVFERLLIVVEPAVNAPLGDDTDITYTQKLDTVINDVRLSIYIPHNATPELVLGTPYLNDKSIIFAAQAADIRRDNKKILGAFVLKGKPLAWGLSKKGYCAIIDGKVTVGVSENSPLFEEATEKGGDFFRQYPLVDNGVLVENEPKNKTMRKALCSRAGEIFVAVSETDESFHDFAQALVDLGVENAVYLVGSHYAFGWYVSADGTRTIFGEDVHKYKNENYIVWR